MFGAFIFADVLGNWVRYVERDFVLKWLGECAEKQVLDLGSGEGNLSMLIARRGASAVTLLDLDLHRLRRASGRLNYVKDTIFLVQADGGCIPILAESIDVVISVSSLEHFVNDRAALQSVYAILKRGGKLIMTVDSLVNKHHDIITKLPRFLLKKELRPFVDLPNKFWKKATQNNSKTYNIVRYYDAKRLKKIFQTVGFNTIICEHKICPPVAAFMYELCMCLRGVRFTRRNPLFVLFFLASPFVFYFERSKNVRGYILAIVAKKAS